MALLDILSTGNSVNGPINLQYKIPLCTVLSDGLPVYCSHINFRIFPVRSCTIVGFCLISVHVMALFKLVYFGPYHYFHLSLAVPVKANTALL